MRLNNTLVGNAAELTIDRSESSYGIPVVVIGGEVRDAAERVFQNDPLDFLNPGATTIRDMVKASRHDYLSADEKALIDAYLAKF